MTKIGRKIAALGLTTVACVTFAGCKSEEGNKVYSNDGTHTYNQATSTFPNNWNPFTYQTETASSLIISDTTSGLYTFDYNEDRTGYQMIDGMAVGDPVDVTNKYVGEEWGIADGDKNRAWEVTLRDDLKFDDDTPITAQTFVDSIELLLQPSAQNYRADSYTYSGSFVIHNAKNYIYQGKKGDFAGDTVYSTYSTENDSKLVFKLGPAATEGGEDVASIRSSLGATTQTAAQVAEVIVKNYLVGKIEDQYGDDKGTTYPAVEDDGAELIADLAKMEGMTLAAIKADSSVSDTWNRLIAWWQTMADEELDFFVVEDYEWPKVAFEDVGVKAVDGKLVYIIDNPLEGFYLKYAMPSPLVNVELYKSTLKTENSITTSTYGTSVETYSSYGPYKLTSFQMDKEIVLERNENWYGYNDKEPGPGWYQTDRVVTQCVKEDNTRLSMFLNGQLDSYGLTEADMEEYQSSPYTYYSGSASTFFVAINPQGAKEDANSGDRALSNLSFRKALSFSIDRKAFALACSPMNNAATALFSTLNVSDPDNGTTYRSEEAAKDVILEFWGLADEVGEGKRYATKDEAIASITGVDVAQAKEMFNEAAETLKAEGKWDGNSTIDIVIGIPSTVEFYSKGFDSLTASWNEAAKGTPFEGKLNFTKDESIGDGFGDALRGGQVDILFGVGWSGSELDPYNLMSAYVAPNQQYDTGISYSTVSVEVYFENVTVQKDGQDVELHNVTLVSNAYDLGAVALSGQTINVTVKETGDKYQFTAGSNVAYETRIAVLAACEGAVLEQYTMLPLIDNSSAQLRGQKINFATEEYVFGMGFGGFQYFTYNYDDEGWAEYVKDSGGTLNYK